MKYAQLVAILAFLLFTTACSQALLRFYTLDSVIPEARTETAETEQTDESVNAKPKTLKIVISPITLPDTVDRAQLVTQAGPNQVEIHETHRWAHALKQEIPHVVAQNLAKILPHTHVAAAPQYVISDPDYIVQLDVQRFDTIPEQGVRIDVLWTVRRMQPNGVSSGFSQMLERPAEAGLDGLVAAHSRALARISNDIAKTIQVTQ